MSSSENRPEEYRKLYLYCAYAALITFIIFLATIPAREYIQQGYVIADSAVYLRVAFNIVNGFGTTYNLVTPTNGYHPLWLIMHLPLMLGTDNILDRLPVVRVLWLLTALGASAVWSLYLGKLTGSHFGAAFMLLLLGVFGFFGWSQYVLYSGIETPLVLLLIGLATVLTHRFVEREDFCARNALILGVVMGLGFLARLDSVFVLAPLACFAAWHISKVSLPNTAIFVATGLALTVPYLAWNQVNFGALTPVSGVVKSFDTLSLTRSFRYFDSFVNQMDSIGMPVLLLWLIIGLLALLVLLVVWKILARDAGDYRFIWILLAGSLAHYLYYFLFISELNVSWHLYLVLMSLFVLTTLAAERFAAFLRSRTGFPPAFFFVLCFAGLFIFNQAVAAKKTYRTPAVAVELELGEWVRANIDPAKRIVFYDSFFSALVADRHIFIDSNGLTGDEQLARLARNNRLARHFDEYERQDIAAIYAADYLAFWYPGHCLPADAGERYAWVSRKIETNTAQRLVLSIRDRAASLGEPKAYVCDE